MSAETSTNTLGATNHSDKEREALDFYQTPQYAVDSIADAQSVLHRLNMDIAGVLQNGLMDDPVRQRHHRRRLHRRESRLRAAPVLRQAAHRLFRQSRDAFFLDPLHQSTKVAIADAAFTPARASLAVFENV